MQQFPGGQAATADQFPDLPSGAAQLAQGAAILGPSAQGAGVLISIYNQLIDLQLMYRDPQAGGSVGFKYGPIIQGLYPGGFTFPGAIGFRARSHQPGNPAQMIAQVWDIQDGPLPQTPLSPNVQTLSASGSFGTAVIIPKVGLAAWPPVSPVDGQTVILSIPASFDSSGHKVEWFAEYDAADAVWQMSGPPLNGTTTITVPRAGTYLCEIGCQGISVGASANVQLSLTAGGASLGAFGGTAGGGTEGALFSIYDSDRMVGLTTNQVLTPSSTGSQAGVRNYIRLHPLFLT